MSSPVPAPTSSLAIQPGQASFTQTQVAALRQLGLDKAGDADLAVFFHTCVRTGLDPFRKQIYMIGRWDSRAQRERYTIQTGIDGYRVIANRTGVYVGSDETWVNNSAGRPISATVTVRKLVAGVPFDFAATAHWDEYVQTTKDGKPAGLWAKMPHRMLAKCAEALALRKAFPEDLAGIYTDEEMSQADRAPVAASSTTITVDATPEWTEDASPFAWASGRFVTAETLGELEAAATRVRAHLTDDERAELRPIYLHSKERIATKDAPK